MKPIPNTLAIYGAGPAAADIALRTTLKFKEHSGPAVILDFTGRGAIILGEDNKMSLKRHAIQWYNLADRLRPVSLFQLRCTPDFQKTMLHILKIIRQVSRLRIADSTLIWATEAAHNLSNNGRVGLVALLKSLAMPETRRWFMSTQNEPADLNQLLMMLSWALRFPSVYSISEGNNKIDIEESLQKDGISWFEAPVEYFEMYEHRLIAGLLDAAIAHAIKNISNNKENNDASARAPITVVHLFPLESICSAVPEWVQDTCGSVRHMGIHKFQSDRPLHPMPMAWATTAANVWVAGKVLPVKTSAHKNWLTETEIDRINSLDVGFLWVKSNDTGKSIVTKVRFSLEPLDLSYSLRQTAASRRKIAVVRQMASAAATIADIETVNVDIYQKLCDKEILRLGWLKINTGRHTSRGVDNVTISAFKEKLEDELSKLSQELTNKEYRSKPLRHFQVPKSDGKKRDIGIASVRDRLVQAACLMLMEPVFDPGFSNYSFAFRPHRSAHQALAVARSMIASGRTWVITADIQKCFDSIDHEVLLNLISRLISDRDLLALIQHWLTVDILDFQDILPNITGIPQGASLSPLLANIYLDPLDKHFERLGLNFVRYADDIVIFVTGKEDAIKAHQLMHDFLMVPLHLALKPAKTACAAISAGFDFLGFNINQDDIKVRQEKVDSASCMLRDQIKKLGSQTSSLDKRADSLMRINAIVRGWRNYFDLPDEKSILKQMRGLDDRIEQMAHYYLPVAIREDPAWVCREKFAPTGSMDKNKETEEEAAEREAKTGIGYPEHCTDARPSRYMIKDSSGSKSISIINKPQSVVEVSAGDDEDSESGNMSDTLIENSARLYVLEHGSYLSSVDDSLIIRRRKIEIYRRPLNELSLIYLQGFGINISVDVQVRLAEMDIPVILAPPVGHPVAVVNPIKSTKSDLRRLQVLRRDDPDIVGVGLSMISSKIGNQAAVLSYFSKYRKKTNSELGKQLTETADKLRDLAANVQGLDPCNASGRTSALGFEGHAAALYWRQLARLIPDCFGFNGRITKSATDAVNQCLNYVYGILYGEVWRAVVKSGLDPYFGLMHGSKRDQGSLVFDMIEEFRAPFADRLVIGMLGRGFTPEIAKHGFLKAKAKKQLALSFIKKWSKKMAWRSRILDPAAILSGQAHSIAKLYNRDGSYHSYKMRW